MLSLPSQYYPPDKIHQRVGQRRGGDLPRPPPGPAVGQAGQRRHDGIHPVRFGIIRRRVVQVRQPKDDRRSQRRIFMQIKRPGVSTTGNGDLRSRLYHGSESSRDTLAEDQIDEGQRLQFKPRQVN